MSRLTSGAVNPNATLLRKAAKQIREAGHCGWGNACEQAADEIESQSRRIAEIEKIIARDDTKASYK